MRTGAAKAAGVAHFPLTGTTHCGPRTVTTNLPVILVLYIEGRLLGKPAISRRGAQCQWRSMAEHGPANSIRARCYPVAERGKTVYRAAETAITTVYFGTPSTSDHQQESLQPVRGVAGRGWIMDGLGGWFIDGVQGQSVPNVIDFGRCGRSAGDAGCRLHFVGAGMRSLTGAQAVASDWARSPAYDNRFHDLATLSVYALPERLVTADWLSAPGLCDRDPTRAYDVGRPFPARNQDRLAPTHGLRELHQRRAVRDDGPQRASPAMTPW